MTTRALRQVPCPECGLQFTARGLSGHRRLQHGLTPRAALPAEEDPLDAAPSAILSALMLLQTSVVRLEQNLLALQRPVDRRETTLEEIARLELELAQLIEHIVKVQPSCATAELARLRRDQARMVFRIDELRSGKPSDESFLT